MCDDTHKTHTGERERFQLREEGRRGGKGGELAWKSRDFHYVCPWNEGAA